MSAAKKTKYDEDYQPEHVTVSWIAKRHSMSASLIRKKIKAGEIKAEMTLSQEFRIQFKDYLEWKAREFRPYVQP
jgi:hypothetical protein